MRGNARGVTSSVATQFTIPTASWLVASSRRMASATSTASATPSPCAFAEQRRGERRRDHRDRAEVQQQRDPPAHPVDGLGSETDASSPLVRAAADPCRSDRSRRGRRDRRRRRGRRAARAVVRELDRLARHVAFRQAASFRDLLDDVPVPVAGREIHPAVEPARILPQLVLDDAHRFDELAPVHRPQEAQAADRVADRNLVAGLLLRFRLHQLLDRRSPTPTSRCSIQVSGKASAALCPCSRRASSATNELTIGGFERAMSAITRIRLLGSCSAISTIWSAHASARFAVDRAGRNAGADAAKILDERQAQHDGNGPQLPHLERRHRLVGRHEAGKALRVDPAVAVGDRLEREIVDARKPGGRAGRQARKLAAVALGQVPPGRADLLFDQVEVVEQPFRGGRDAAVRS